MPDTMMGLAGQRVRIGTVATRPRLLLRGDAAALERRYGMALPREACTAAEADGRAALWLGPDEWLLLLRPGEAAAPWDDAEGAAFDVSHRQVGIEVAGAGAASVLEAECPLDVAGLAAGFCSRTVWGKAEIVLWRREQDLFHLEAWRSFAPYVEGLLEAVSAA